ncbi:hypothetical protein ACFLTH_08995 [Bacteroidota bacterium]
MSKKKRKEFINFIILIAVMLILLLGLMAYGKFKARKEIDMTKYNNYNFRQDRDGFWMTAIQIGDTLYPITFYSHPREVENINFEEDVENTILIRKSSELIIAIPPKPNPVLAFAGRQISKITEGILGISTVPMLNGPEDELDYVTCESDASESRIILSFIPSDKNLVYMDNKNPYCIKLEFNNLTSVNESMRVADSFAYHLLKIM